MSSSTRTAIVLSSLLVVVAIVVEASEPSSFSNMIRAAIQLELRNAGIPRELYLDPNWYDAFIRSVDQRRAARAPRVPREPLDVPIWQDQRNYVNDNADIQQIADMIEREYMKQEYEEPTNVPSKINIQEALEGVETVDEDACAVCLDTMDADKSPPVRTLQCGHMFHHLCLHKWAQHVSR